MVSEKTGCSSGFRVNQYKSLCAFSLSLNSLNSVLIFVSVRIYGLKREGGELFKKDFRKLLSLRMKILQENFD